jgi:sarcosine oxidase subunit beta
MPETYEAIVIGAGVVGVSIAFHLSERGLKTVILERKQLASGATGRSSGLVRMHYDLEADSRLAWISFQYFRNWRERVGGECGFNRTGFLFINSPAYNSQVRANVEMHKKIGISSSIISAAEVKAMVPAFSTDDFEIAAYEPDSGYADPAMTTQSFLDAAKSKGTIYRQDCEVTGLIVSGSKVSGVETSRRSYLAPVVVNAAGAWAVNIGKMAGLQIPLDTWTHDVAHFRRPAAIADHPTVIDDSLSMYFRPDTGGLTLVALEDNNRMGESPDADSTYVAKDFVERAADRICQRMPAMEMASVQSTHVGRDGLTPDQRAVLGQAGPKGFYLATGFSGTGFKTSPAVGLCMSELIVDGKPKSMDISPFALERFERGQLLKGEHDYGNIWR